ncbi:unnamed protein product [Phytomonas sp. Hart1]|nr:unnamed protein product [Phytomonas sp. Hart1]|eukprot:CCW66459.1 unnamed protein product [Phytomonas sp. isolate Hart1]
MTSITSPSLMETVQRSVSTSGWNPQQKCFRNLMKSLRDAYFHDRSKLFWARHRVLVEFYKYSKVEDHATIELLVGLGNEIATFVSQYMKMDVERIVKHNQKMLSLPVDKAKRYRADYYLHERQHESWCKQKIKAIMNRRPPPPYPFF